MNKIFFLIPFLMLGCSTPEIHIPSYDFSSDTNSTEMLNKAEKATSKVASIEEPDEIVDTNIIEITETEEILPDVKAERVIEISKVETVEEKPKNINKSSGFFSSMFKPKQKVKNEYFTGGKIRSKLVMSDATGESGLLYKYGYEGQVTSTVHVKNGIKNGLETLFDVKGRVMKRTPFVSGKKDGIVEVYYADGKVLAQIAYVNNKRHGRASKYNHDGTTNEEIHYTHGKVQTQDSDIEIPIID